MPRRVKKEKRMRDKKPRNLALVLLVCLSSGCSSINKTSIEDKADRLTYEEKLLLEKEREEKATQHPYASSEELYLYHPEKEVRRPEAIRETVKNILPFLAPVIKYSEYKFRNGRIGFGLRGGPIIYLEWRF